MVIETGTEASVVYVVRTPVTDYNGVTAGVVFRDGAAAILTSEFGLTHEEATEKARELQEDFGYHVSPSVPRAPRPAMTRPLHPIEDVAPDRTFPFFPRDPNLPPGADVNAAIPHQSRIVHKATEVTTEITTEMETPDGEDSEVR